MNGHKRSTVFLCFLMTVFLTACFLISGCSGPNIRQNTEGSRIVTDAQGTEMKIPDRPVRIVSLTLGTDEMLMNLVSPERIAALTYLSDDSTISHIADRSGAVQEKIKNGSAESVLALQPDLVLAADWWPAESIQFLRDMGVPVFVCRTPASVEEVKTTVRELGSAVGEREKAEEIIQQFETEISDTEKHLDGKISEKDVLHIIVMSGMGAFGGQGTLYDDMCRIAHVENCMADVKADSTGNVSKEMILEKKPDLILIPKWDAPGMENPDFNELLQDPSLQSVPAVRNKKIKVIPGKYLYCTSEYVAAGIRELAEAAYPECFQ